MKTFNLFLALFACFPSFSQSWNTVGSGTDGAIYALAVYNGELYAGGDFTSPGNYIAKWDGSSWTAVGSGVDNSVYCLHSWQGNLFAGGWLSGFISRWDGANWSPVGGGTNNIVTAVSDYAGHLLAGGSFITAGGNSAVAIAKWDGANWSSVGGGMNSSVLAIKADTVNNLAYCAGAFSVAGGNTAFSVAKWNGSNWSAIGAGISDTGFVVVNDILISSAGNLYAGGQFTKAGGNTAMNIAKWDGSNWSAVDGGMNSYVNALAIYNGELYAGGNFTSAGSSSASYIAKISLAAGIFEPDELYRTLQVYPNPASRNEAIHFEAGDCHGDCLMTIYDCFGAEVEREILNGSSELRLGLAPGIYFYRFQDYSGKIVIK